MNDNFKIFAPRPVRASSNRNEIKMSCNLNYEYKLSKFEKIDQPFNSYTPKLNNQKLNLNYEGNIKIYSRKLDYFRKTSLEWSVNTQQTGRTKFLQDDNPFSVFEKNLEKDFRNINSNDEDSFSKGEILSILRNDSTFYESVIYRSDYFGKDEEDEIIIDEEIITNVPPRIKNPFIKNFNLDIPKCGSELVNSCNNKSDEYKALND